MNIIGLSGTSIFFIVFSLFVVILVFLGIKNVMEGHVRLVERFGKYHKTLRPGINFLLPGIDIIKTDFDLYTYHFDKDTPSGMKRVDISHELSRGDINMREQMMDPPEFDTIAADNAVVHPDIISYFIIIDAHKAVYNVDNLGEALIKLMETTIRQEVGRQNSDDLIVSRQQIGANVQRELTKFP